ncbi:hypothetical protein D8I24_2137 [Cupriavidus necator H850]|uniref:hypothetical protein n=1 Tax=Cupriavidus necator TaxID=106590 RepID=UPI00129E04CF|nr:hypothetical protein [Cupriavidus necator]KAI3606294.1 hypothetical protein D8I24_2137 [Cupriavidus necator H850]
MPIILASKLDRTIIQMPISKQTYLTAWAPFKKFCGTYLTTPDPWANQHTQCIRGSFLNDAVLVEFRSAYGKRFVRYTLLPARLKAAEFEAFAHKSAALGIAEYKNVLAHGYLREFEIAVDYVSKHTKDYLFYRHGVHSGKHVKGTLQAAGTYYQGAVTSDLQTCAYNKGTQLKEKGLSCPFPELLRVEAKFRHREIKVSELATVPNPFAKMLICSLHDLHKAYHPEPAIWQAFLARSAALGVSTALSTVPSKYRQQVRATLKQHCAPWWKPETLMIGFAERAAKQLRFDLSG